jgi:hypothetical protein
MTAYILIAPSTSNSLSLSLSLFSDIYLFGLNTHICAWDRERKKMNIANICVLFFLALSKQTLEQNEKGENLFPFLIVNHDELHKILMALKYIHTSEKFQKNM